MVSRLLIHRQVVIFAIPVNFQLVVMEDFVRSVLKEDTESLLASKRMNVKIVKVVRGATRKKHQIAQPVSLARRVRMVMFEGARVRATAKIVGVEDLVNYHVRITNPNAYAVILDLSVRRKEVLNHAKNVRLEHTWIKEQVVLNVETVRQDGLLIHPARKGAKSACLESMQNILERN